MQILFVIANNSSVPYFTLFMKNAMNQKEYNFGFVALTSDYPTMIQEAESYGHKGYWIPFNYKNRKVEMIKAFFKLYKLFKKLKPDVVHTHLFDDSVPALLAARFAKVPIRVITKQDTAFHYYYARKWVVFDKLNNWNATHVVAVSSEAKQFIHEKEKCNPQKLYVIHHGIDVERFANPDSEWVSKFKNENNLNQKFVVGTVARFIAWKKYDTIVEIAEHISTKIPEIRFLLIGQGDEMPKIKAMILEKGLSDFFIFTGFIDKNQIQNVYSAMDVYLHTAEKEPFGFVIAEAMAANLPVVSTPTGAALDGIIHKKNGWIGEYNNSHSLSEGLEYFYYTNNINNAKYHNSETYSFNKMFNNYINLYFSRYNINTR